MSLVFETSEATEREEGSKKLTYATMNDAMQHSKQAEPARRRPGAAARQAKSAERVRGADRLRASSEETHVADTALTEP